MFLHVQSDKEAALFEAQVPTMVTLTKGCKSVSVVRELSQIPDGCGSVVLTPAIAVYVLVRVRLPPPAPPGSTPAGTDADMAAVDRARSIWTRRSPSARKSWGSRA